MPRLFRDQDFLTGIVFIFFGVGYFLLSLDLEFGSPRRMGPGFFPAILTALLVAIGLFLALRALWTSGEAVAGLSPKAVLFVSAATVVFGLLIRGGGVVVAVTATVLVASLASRRTRPVSAVLLAVILSAFSVFVFVEGLGLPMPVLGSWLTR